jgi:hypothetical protein
MAERAMPPADRIHSRFLWAMFAGAYPYRQLVAMAMHPLLHLRLLRGAISAMRRSRVPSERAPATEADDGVGGI